MERWSDRVAVVTGASSGMGVAIVKDLLLANIIVIGLARRLGRMEAYKAELPAEQQERFHPYFCDVSSQESVDEAFDKIIAKFGGVDVLINNAGILRLGQASTMNTTAMAQTLQVNVMGVVYATQRAFKSMKERDVDGHVVIINSYLGHTIPVTPDVPVLNIYPPSKYAITALTEIYRQEFKGLGSKVKVTSVSPGVTDTEILPDEYKKLGHPMLKPEDIASCVHFTLATPPRMQVHEIIVKPAFGE